MGGKRGAGDEGNGNGIGEEEEEQKKKKKIKIAALPWMRKPLDLDAFPGLPLDRVPSLDPRLEKALHAIEVTALFPVQEAVWHQVVGPGQEARDLCVCAPTGSGKTLAYALPVVQVLSARIVRRLRALVVLPTRDLAIQVKAVFDKIAPSVGLTVGLAVGQTEIAAEAADLVKCPRQCMHPFAKFEAELLESPESRVDVLVATPGRLMDHMENTPGFTLQHLRYLIVDETDRLLRQSYQNWLPNVLTATKACQLAVSGASKNNDLGVVRTVRHSGLSRGFKGTCYPRVVKLILSATLTRDPTKISKLELFYPMYIASSADDNRYQLPEQLQAYKLVCNGAMKPLYLMSLLQQLKGEKTIVFTASVEATHRLYLLLLAYKDLDLKVVEYSSQQHQHLRSKALATFREGDADVLVASDAMTRGMDIEGVRNVINYDVPVYPKTYVHRVGRTARAGREGYSYTILRKEEVRHFKALLLKADHSACKNYSLPADLIDKLHPGYLTALGKLKEDIATESKSK